MFHETWGQMFEVIVGTILLSWEVGWLWPAPLLMILCRSKGITLTFSLGIPLKYYTSMLTDEPVRCKKPAVRARELERGDSEPDFNDKRCYQQYEKHQDAWLARCNFCAYTRPTES
ncbi:hypothetical protein F4779DRAFT_98443 [Xylariaceae sp. FL0662B]|nr:hypothetical protein F4779DRAFT_98443 [Xylariaceae sp. FL0662B]